MAATASVEVRTVGVPGRYLMSSGRKHMVVDASEATGGNAENFVAQELLVGALATCAQAVIHAKAVERNLSPRRVRVQVRSERDSEARPPVYTAIQMDVAVSGLSQAEAQELVDQYTSVCPIYYTVSVGAPVTVSVRIDEDQDEL